MSITKKMNSNVSSGVDWISATRVLKSDNASQSWLIFKRIVLAEKLRHMRLFGFDGEFYKDIACGHAFYGINTRLVPQRDYLQLGGVIADNWWLQVFNSQVNVTRLDLKVDAELYDPDAEIAQISYDNFLDCMATNSTRIKSYDFRRTSKGQTLYIGSRYSKIFGRLYDKSAQLSGGKEFGKIWRYELQIGHEAAMQVTLQLADIFNNSKSSIDGLCTIAKFVSTWFEERGVPTIYDSVARCVSRIEVKSESRYGDKMLWLRQQVSPSVRRLIASGYGDDVVDALGLKDYLLSLGIQKSLLP